MGRILGATIATLLAVSGASAQTPATELTAGRPVPPGIDRALWCASAFYWLAGSAEDSGDHDEAELYDGWSTRLLEMAAAAMTSIEVPPERIESLAAEYDQRALEELGSGAAPYDIALCPDLFGDEAVAPAGGSGNVEPESPGAEPEDLQEP